MLGQSLSVVMPVFNEAEHLGGTISALADSVADSGFEAELVLVDDGSTDDSVAVARRAAEGRLSLLVVSQPNSGRFEARRAGLKAAQGEYVLFLDARVRLAPGGLRFVHDHLHEGRVWNGHVHVVADGALGDFWRLLAELAWRDYFDEPRTTSFGVEDFDRFPKGTTCFFAPRELLEPAFAGFRSQYADVRHANDDTPIMRAIAARERIHISPEFACTYSPRTSVASFFRHALHRGTVFVDGHGTPESRFFPAVAAFFPVSAALALAAVKRPATLPAALAGCGLAAAAYGVLAGRSPKELRTLALVTPLYALGHGLGMWRGAVELLR
jgi:glycosyltransferase involved in cell wall biosynthesis